MQIISSILSLLATSTLLLSPVAAEITQTYNPAIVVVIDSYTHLQELCHTFFTLIRATGFPNAPIFAFTAISLQAEDISDLRLCTPRVIEFKDISGFHHNIPDGAAVTMGVNYDYPQTQRFLTKYIWDQDVLSSYDVLMHISDHTCLTFESDYLPGFPPSDTLLNYKSYSIPGVHEITKQDIGIYENTVDYMSDQSISAVNVHLWDIVVSTQEELNKHIKFSDDFEIVRKSFMQSSAVRLYHHHLSDSQKGVQEFFYRNWSASFIMYMTVALFAEPDSVSTVHVPGIVEKDFWNGNFFRNICRKEKGVMSASGYW